MRDSQGNSSNSRLGNPTKDDLRYQEHILQGVSRTFALTIPQLPEPLSGVVSNAYLLCRIADTIEDEATLSPQQKRTFSEQFIAVVEGTLSAEEFARNVCPLLSKRTLAAERDLVRQSPRVIRITHSYNETQRSALSRCIRIMAQGMAMYQEKETLDGLADLKAMDDYCYYVAGVVGEMLTELFCDYSEQIKRNQQTLMPLAVSFGQGLQMTNILKDIWEDRGRGACWLPRDIFADQDFDLRHLGHDTGDPRYHQGLGELLGVAQAHLRNALTYTLLIPTAEKGIRRFCLWAIGMAVLTLKNVNRRRNFSAGDQVKISRRSVKATIFLTNISVSNDSLLKFLFNIMTKSLPNSRIHEKLTALNYSTGA